MQLSHSANLTGQRIQQYALLSLIGSGGMADVYWARDERLHRDVAVKALATPAARGRRRGRQPKRGGPPAEARALSRLSHPHITAIYDFLRHRDQEFIVMELVAGATLREVLAGGPLPPFEVVRLGRQLVSGLAAAHAAHVIHRDIKPANLKITSSGVLKILDFGIAALSAGETAPETVNEATSGLALVGTVPYMAPERLRGETADARSDVFSAGAVLYEMAAGCRAFPQRPIASLVEAILGAKVIPLSIANPLVPAALERIVMKALANDPGDRQQSAAALLAELDGLPTTEAAGPGTRPAPRSPRGLVRTRRSTFKMPTKTRISAGLRGFAAFDALATRHPHRRRRTCFERVLIRSPPLPRPGWSAPSPR